MESTQVATVLDALLTTVKTAMPSVEVIDGQPVKITQKDCLILGWSPSRPAVEISQSRTGLQKDRRQETLTIAGVVSTWRGGTKPATVSEIRNVAVGLLDDLRDILAANRTLGDVVTRATLGYTGTLDQAQTADGAAATLDFTIDVTTL